MNKPRLDINGLISETKKFCQKVSTVEHPKLLGVTDGKAVGTYLEMSLKEFLGEKFDTD